MKSPHLQKLTERLQGDDNVLFSLIFGSHAEGRAGRKSDLDLALYFDDPPLGLDLLDLIHELSEPAGVEVDVVVLNSSSAFMRHQVMKHGLRFMIADCFAALGQAGVVAKDDVDTYKAMARYRNRLIHADEGVEDAVTYGVFRRRLGDFRLFASSVRAYLAQAANGDGHEQAT